MARTQRDEVRLVELSWRALEDDDRLDEVEYRDVVEMKRGNPLLALLAGYRMWRTPRAASFASGPLAGLLAQFHQLPDVHVLAGLHDPARRDEHFERAARAGTPFDQHGLARARGLDD